MMGAVETLLREASNPLQIICFEPVIWSVHQIATWFQYTKFQWFLPVTRACEQNVSILNMVEIGNIG